VETPLLSLLFRHVHSPKNLSTGRAIVLDQFRCLEQGDYGGPETVLDGLKDDWTEPDENPIRSARLVACQSIRHRWRPSNTQTNFFTGVPVA
jgi:hypothetical protein